MPVCVLSSCCHSHSVSLGRAAAVTGGQATVVTVLPELELFAILHVDEQEWMLNLLSCALARGLVI